MRQQARLFRSPLPGMASEAGEAEQQRPERMRTPGWVRVMWLGFGGFLAIVVIALASVLVALRVTHADRIFPNISVADVAIGGMPMADAAAAISARADSVEASAVSFSYQGKTWSTTLRDVGLSIDEGDALSSAEAYGREGSAYDRLRSTTRLARVGARLSLPMELDVSRLNTWFDEIDAGLGAPPHDAMLEVQGSNVVIVPEVDGIVVDRAKAQSVIISNLQNLSSTSAELPITTKIAAIRDADLEPAKMSLLAALAQPIQVAYGSGIWTLPTTEMAQFLVQDVENTSGKAPSLTMGLDQEKLATWLSDRLGDEIRSDPEDAEVGWDGSKLVSVVDSVDGVQLDASKLALAVEERFFHPGAAVQAPVVKTKPEIDSGNLGALGITTLLGSGQSNYAGSTDGRATNVAVGAGLVNGTLIPPYGTYSFNDSIGIIDEDKGFVEAQVIAGESIGRDIGGGICQVSTTVFRAAFLAGLPITEWWPHRFRIGFYEFDGWDPGLDASILQPTADPATWADFKFENPSDTWMLVESWTDGENVFVNIYGKDLGYEVEVTGPTWGNKMQMLAPKEEVDPKLDPGTVSLLQAGGIGEELTQYRVVKDRNGALLWERSFYTKYYPRGDIWEVSPDMKGQAPIDPNFKFPPLPPAGIDSKNWVPGAEMTEEFAATEPAAEPWTPPVQEATTDWVDDGGSAVSGEWVPSDDAATGDTWSPPSDGAVSGEEWVPPVEDVPAA